MTWEEMSFEEKAMWARECLNNPAFDHAMKVLKDASVKKILEAREEESVLKGWAEHKAMMTVLSTIMHEIQVMTRLEGGAGGPNKEFIKNYDKEYA